MRAIILISRIFRPYKSRYCTVANAILSESALSYLGLGVVPPTPSWGNMMDAANSLIDFQRRPWLWMPPGIAIFITVIAINVLGDGLRDAMDPNMKPRLK